MHRSYVNYLLILAASCLLAACGFQLRGSDGLSALPDTWKNMYLDSATPNNELSHQLKVQFINNGVNWAEQRQDASYTLELGEEDFTSRNLSLNAQARAAEYELTMETTFSVRDAEGTQVIAKSVASVIEQMENDPRNVVGKAEEARIIKSEMRTQLAQQIVRRIAFYANSQD